MLPRIHLTLDNCFGIKRWVRPEQWMAVAHELGFTRMEASVDNECDPLFNPPEYRADWLKEVKSAQQRYGISVVSFFTGYQTYRTVGLVHHDPRVRERLLEGWFRPMFATAAELNSILGVYFHAFSNEVLQSAELYRQGNEKLLGALARAAEMAAEAGDVPFCYEQMYAPHQTPWTIAGSFEMLKAVKERSGKPMYLTLDVGHQVGQRRYRRPTRGSLRAALKSVLDGNEPSIWLGTDRAYDEALSVTSGSLESTIDAVLAEIEAHPYLFAQERDSDTYAWLENLACFSPIIHLQQTDGIRSHHAPFNEETNRTGIIKPRKVLEAIRKSYEKPMDPSLPERTEDIYLVFEIFGGTADSNRSIVSRLRQSIDYWRTVIPEDGLTLDALL